MIFTLIPSKCGSWNRLFLFTFSGARSQERHIAFRSTEAASWGGVDGVKQAFGNVLQCPEASGESVSQCEVLLAKEDTVSYILVLSPRVGTLP